MQSPDDIVISGMGVVAPIGVGVDAFWQSLATAKGGVQDARQFDVSAGPAAFAGEVRDFDPKDLIRPRKNIKVMARETQFAVAAAEMACRQASLTGDAVDPARKAIVLGSDMIHCQPSELAAAFAACRNERGGLDVAAWGDRAMPAIFPLWLLKYLPNMPACHIAIAQDAQGPNNSVTLGDISSLLAIGEATRVLQRGAADAILVGGTGSYVHPTVLVRSKLLELSQRRDEPCRASRPFDVHRDGMVLGEGAAVFVLERRSRAHLRKAPILAKVLSHACGYARPRPGSAPPVELLRRIMRQALERASLLPGDVGHVNACGLSTTAADQAEAEAIRAELGDTPVTAPKGHFGNLGAGSGAVEIVTSILGLSKGIVPPTLNHQHADDKCPINVVSGDPIAARNRIFLKIGHSPTGQSAATVIHVESSEA